MFYQKDAQATDIALLNRKSGVRILHFRRIKRLAVIANHKLHIVMVVAISMLAASQTSSTKAANCGTSCTSLGNVRFFISILFEHHLQQIPLQRYKKE